MFELVRAYETAKNEKNKFLRLLYTKYTKHKLKSAFFEKFDIYNHTLDINKDLISEFIQLYECTSDEVYVNEKYTHVYKVNPTRQTIFVKYYNIAIILTAQGDSNYLVDMINTEKDFQTYSTELNFKSFNSLITIREIILIGIYNYCVSYIYGNKSKLYIDNTYYIDLLNKIYF